MTWLQNTNGCKGRGRRTADIADDTRGQLAASWPQVERCCLKGHKARRRTSYECDLEWKTKEMQHACWRSAEHESNLDFNMKGVDHRITKSAGNAGGEIAAVKNEANTMWTMRHRRNNAMSAMRAEMSFCKNPGILERRKHERYIQVVQSSLHTSENLELSEGAGRHVAWL